MYMMKGSEISVKIEAAEVVETAIAAEMLNVVECLRCKLKSKNDHHWMCQGLKQLK